jgi:Zn-dependent protease with chaperone function
MAEYTCDRAGLLACQNPDKAFMALIKLSGLPSKYYSPQIIPEFIAQAKEMEEFLKQSNLNKLNEFLLSYHSTHPWTVLRAAELMKWIDNNS